MHCGRGGGRRGVDRVSVSGLRDTNRFGRAAGPDGARDYYRYHAPRDGRPDGVTERITGRVPECFTKRLFDSVSVSLSGWRTPG